MPPDSITPRGKADKGSRKERGACATPHAAVIHPPDRVRVIRARVRNGQDGHLD